MASLPKGIDKKTIRFCRVPHKGGGSLGRPRYVAVAYWRGGQVLREAKALVPRRGVGPTVRESPEVEFPRIGKRPISRAGSVPPCAA